MPELRKKMLYTLFIILIFRFGSCIPVPFIDTQLLAQYFEQASTNGSMLGYLDMFSGGGLSRATIFAMSITPYINASIILQLLTVAIPALERMVKDGGEEGRKKIASWTRYVGVLLGLLQGLSYYALLRNQGFLSDKGVLAAVTIIMTFTAGTALIMWMGEHITQKGIGNGISMILFAGIVSRGPSLMRTLGNLFQTGTSGIVSGIVMIIVGLAIVVFIVYMSNAERRIPVQYAKRVVGRKMYGGQSTHIPIKVNMSGVMPVIFASALASIPGTIGGFFPNLYNPDLHPFAAPFLGMFSTNGWVYAAIYLLLIIAFNYFYVAMQYNPVEIANNLRNNNGTIPGYRPGKPTSDFITKVLGKITFIGALFLGVVAVMPIVLGNVTGENISLGGTSLLIVVGVALDTSRSLESYMLMRHHKGFLE